MRISLFPNQELFGVPSKEEKNNTVTAWSARDLELWLGLARLDG